MVIWVVEFSGGGYKIRKIFAGAETIQGRKLFKGGNYSRKYGTYFLKIVISCQIVKVLMRLQKGFGPIV